MSDSFENVDLKNVRMISFEERQIKVIFNDRKERFFKFGSREQMESAIEFWVKKNEVTREDM